MNKKLSYELLISDKLEALPIPDLADSIWSRIEARLDLDLPADGGDDIPDAPLAPSGIWKGTGISILAIIIIFLLLRTTEKQENNSPLPVINEPAIIASPARGPSQPIPEKSLPVNNPSVNTPLFSPAPAPADDSVFTAADEFIPEKDSLSAPPLPRIFPTVLPVAIQKDSLPKKPRGVQGINPEDYRIEPARKDSN